MAAPRLALETRITLWTLGFLVVSLVSHGADISPTGLLDRSGRLKASDYMRLYVTGSLADAGRWTELYSAEAHVREAHRRIDPRLSMAGLHPNYGPTAALLLAPISRLPFLASWTLFSVASIAAFLVGVSLLVTTTSELSTHRRLVLLVCVASPALFETLRYGQLSAVTTA